MAPIAKKEELPKRNLKCYFKKSLTKFKSPLVKVMGILKAALGLKDIKMLALQNWDLVNKNVYENSEDDKKYTEIFTKLLLKMQTCDRFVQREYFIQFEKNDSSRYYAAFLWNFKLLCEAEENEGTDQYLNKSVACTILKMVPQDLTTIRKLITGHCPHLFPALLEDLSNSDLMFYLLEELSEKRDVLIELIHLWFLKTPLLEEIAKYVTWGFLNDISAALLNLNDLYELFINQCYRNLT